MGEVIDLAEVRAQPRIRIVPGDSVCVTTKGGPVQIHCYSYRQGARFVLGLVESGAIFATDSVVLKLVPRPPPPPPEPPKPPELLVNREFSSPPWWRRLLGFLRPRPRLLKK